MMSSLYKYFRWTSLLMALVIYSPNISRSESTTPLSTVRSVAHSVSWNHDGMLLAVGGDFEIQLYNKDLKFIKSLPSEIEEIHCLAWNFDGTKLAVGGESNRVEVWDVDEGHVATYFSEHTNDVTGIAWKAGSNTVASASLDATVRIWDAGTGKQIKLLEQSVVGGVVSSVQWNKDGTQLLIVAQPQALRVLAVASGQLTFDLPDQITTNFNDTIKPVTIFAAWNPDNSAIAIGYAGVANFPAVKILGAATQHTIATFGTLDSLRIVDSLAWDPDGKVLAVLDDNDTIHIWNIVENRERTHYKGASLAYWPSYPNNLSWSPDGEKLAIADSADTIHILDMKTNQVSGFPVYQDLKEF